MNKTDTPKREYVRIEVGQSRYSPDETALYNDLSSQTVEFRLLSGGYLDSMKCRSEKYGDKWETSLYLYRSGDFHLVDFNYIHFYPLEHPRRLEPGEVLRSLAAWSPEKFIDRDAIEQYQQESIDHYNYWMENVKINFPHVVSGTKGTRLQVSDVRQYTSAYLLLSGEMQKYKEVTSETHGDRWRILRWRQEPPPELDFRVELEPLDTPRKLEEGEILSSDI